MSKKLSEGCWPCTIRCGQSGNSVNVLLKGFFERDFDYIKEMDAKLSITIHGSCMDLEINVDIFSKIQIGAVVNLSYDHTPFEEKVWFLIQTLEMEIEYETKRI